MPSIRNWISEKWIIGSWIRRCLSRRRLSPRRLSREATPFISPARECEESNRKPNQVPSGLAPGSDTSAAKVRAKVRKESGVQPLSTLLPVCILLFLAVLLVSAAAPEKRLAIYSTAANYSLPILQRQGHGQTAYAQRRQDGSDVDLEDLLQQGQKT